jgi:cellulose synthase operon protein C
LSTRRRIALAAALLLALSACRSPEQKAAIAEARYDGYFAQGDFPRARVEIRNAIRANEDVSGYWVKLGRLELVTGNLPGAYAAYSRALELQRDNREALQYLAQLAMAGGDFAEATQHANDLLVLAPGNVPARLVLGTIQARKKKPEEALRIANEILAEDATVDDAVILKASALEDLKRAPEAVAALEARWQAGGNTVPILQRLLDLYKKGDNEAGIRSTYARLFRLQPKNAAIQIEFARALWVRGATGESQAIIRRVQAQNAADPSIQLSVIQFWRDTAGQAVALAELQKVAAKGGIGVKTALAGYLLEAGEPVSAKRMLAPLIGNNPVNAENAEAQLVFAGADKALGRSADARARLDRVLEFDKTNSRALLLRTELELAAGQLDAALTDVRILVRDNPDFEPGQVTLAKVYAARKEWALADAAFAQARQAYPASMLTFNAHTDYLMSRKNFLGAVSAGVEFTKANAKSVPGWTRLAGICIEAGDEGCAARAIDELSKVEGGQAAAQQMNLLLQRSRAAGQILPQNLALGVNMVMAGKVSIVAVVQQLVSSGKGQLAAQLVNEVLRRQPENSLAQVVAANLVALGGNEAQARVMLAKTIAADPKQTRAYSDLAFSRMRAGDAAGAFATMSQGLRANPGDVGLLNDLAGLQLMANQPRAAIAIFRKVLAARPGDPMVANNLASLLSEFGTSPAELNEAVAIAGRLENRDVAAFNDTRGWALYRIGKIGPARQLIERANAQAAGVPAFLYHLGAVQIAGGQAQEGRKTVQRALASANPKESWIGAARNLLAQN